ncbi:MAG TPA: LuxR family transcriptional regulator [Capillimicrobium sp.]|nr:LuxR family transcriptional regulator [Capillimicrobium sp.]
MDAERDLLERARELHRIDRAVADLRAGRGTVLCATGPAGIGKTALVEACAARAAAAGARVAIARCSPLEREHAFGVARQLLEPLLAAAAPGPDPFAGEAAPARVVLDPGAEGPPPAAHALERGLSRMARNLAGDGPLALVVDDVQWCDEPSLRWLAFLARRIDGGPLLLAVALRSTGEPARSPALDDLLRVGDALVPPPLSAAATGRLLEGVLGAPAPAALAAACHAATGGTPYLLIALAGALRQGGVAPDRAVAEVRRVGGRAVAHHVRARLDATPAAVRRLAEAIAVTGGVADLALLAELAALERADAEDALAVLVAVDIAAAGEPVRCVHPLVEAAVVEAMPAARREALHARAAAALAGRGDVERAATHLLEVAPAGRPERARALRAAAGRATARGAPDVAVALLRRALAEPPAAEDLGGVLLALGAAENATGAYADALGHLEQAAARAVTPQDTAAAGVELSFALASNARFADAVAAADAARAALDGADPALGETLECVALLFAFYVPALAGDRARRIRELGDRPSLSAPGRRFQTAHLALQRLYDGAPEADVTAAAEAALADGPGFAGTRQDVDASVVAALALARTARWRTALAAVDRGAAWAAARAELTLQSTTLNLRAMVALPHGLLARAEADARAVLDLDISPGFGQPVAVAMLVEALLERGGADEARAVLARHGLDGELPDSSGYDLVLHARGRLAAEGGDPAAAIPDLLECGRRQMASGDTASGRIPWRAEAALALAAAGDLDRARALAREDVAIARRTRSPLGLGVALRALAAASAGEERVALLEEAVAALARAESPVVRARALTELGAALRDRGDAARARRVLRTALAAAEASGAEAVADRARDELVRSGARPRRAAAHGAAALTPRQRRVAELAARGLANRAIAQELVVTEKTVEYHLSAIYRRLGIRSRTQLRRALSDGAQQPSP